jgi:NAD(P)-dependent dehydrogenase (short-subunit alcohol dehydrogenase family)
MSNGGRLAGRVALVTGAGSVGPGSGNGRATAVLFAREGASVAVVDRDPEAAAETARLIEAEACGRAVVIEADVTDPASAAAMAARCLDAFGRIDVL